MLCNRSWSFLLLQNALKQLFGVRLTNTFSQHFTIPLKIANPYSLLREKPFPQGFLQKELAIDLFDIYLKRFLREKFTDKLVYGQYQTDTSPKDSCYTDASPKGASLDVLHVPDRTFFHPRVLTRAVTFNKLCKKICK